MVTDTHSKARVQEHAKLLRYAHRQALAFMQRTDDGLTIVIQLWCGREDHQLRIAMKVEDTDNDGVLGSAFEDLNDESLALALDELGVREMLADLEAE